MQEKANQENRREIAAYIMAGLATMIINVAIYQALFLCGVDYKIANAAALFLTKLSAYILNKLCVFRTHYTSVRETMKEMAKFFAARAATGLVDFFGLILLVEFFGVSPLPSKYFMMVLVIILNYVFSKRYVFHGRKSDHGTE